MKKFFLLTVFTLAATLWANAQNLDRMQWFNEPESYTIKNGTLEMDVPAQTDYWRIAHYGFTVDDGQGFKAKFSHFKVKHLPDQRRVEWLKNNQ